MNLSNNTILITGGSRGIGLEMARQFIAKGNSVIVTGRDTTNLSAAAQLLPGLVTLQSDAGHKDDIARLAHTIRTKFPDVNMVINNAGIMRKVNLQNHNLGPDALTREIETNLAGPVQLIDALMPHLKEKQNAAIVNVSSAAAFVPIPVSAVYCATKAALHSYTQSLRVQLTNTSVKVFELMPPATETELLDPFKENMGGANVMLKESMVNIFMAGLERDELEIRPGQAKQMRFFSRFFPNFILRQMSGGAAEMAPTL